MVKYKQTYINHFNLTIGDTIWDEYEWGVNNKLVVAVDIHHIVHGASRHDDITNLMAVSRNNHNKCHSEELNRYFLKRVHLQFMKNNPY